MAAPHTSRRVFFDADLQPGRVDERAAALDAEWNSAAERERTSRSRFAQRSIHPEEVAREVTAIRETLGRTSEVQDFVRRSLTALDGVLREVPASGGDFTADLSGCPVGLRDTLAPLVGSAGNSPLSFRASPAVDRGEAALVRTDPVVSALASHVLNSALDPQIDGRRPARRCGVIRTRAVAVRTTLLLVRYRFQLTLRPAPTSGN